MNMNTDSNAEEVKGTKDALDENEQTTNVIPTKKSYRELGIAWLDSDDSSNAFAGVPV